METTSRKPFLESDIYTDPAAALRAEAEGFGGDAQQYLIDLIDAADPKDNAYQERAKESFDTLIDQGRGTELGRLFNAHRILTEFPRYGANDKTSGDVSFFGEDFEIPETGLIVIDRFVTRNLAAIIETCKERGIDLGRIRVRVDKTVFAAQLVRLSGEKKDEFEQACSTLNEDQFIYDGDLGDEEIALLFTPSTMAIMPERYSTSEEATTEAVQDHVKQLVKNVVTGGRVLGNVAFKPGEPWQGLRTQTAAKGERVMIKINGVTDGIAAAIARQMVALGFEPVEEIEDFDRNQVNKDLENDGKLAKKLHVVKQ